MSCRSFTKSARQLVIIKPVAVVGAGPAGMFVVEGLLAGSHDVSIDVLERLPTPWGLVRAGVAPDHPKIKSVTTKFSAILADPRVRFFGNVEVGTDLTHEELATRYSAVIYATGAPQGRKLDIPGINLPGCYTAAEFVGWYNGHPRFAHSNPPLSDGDVVVVGNGNVALDVARMVLSDPSRLAETDVSRSALRHIERARVRRVRIIGRRGPLEAPFTSKELREITRLPSVRLVVESPEAEGVAASDQRSARNLEILRAASESRVDGATKELVFSFHRRLTGINGEHKVESVTHTSNLPVGPPNGESGAPTLDETAFASVVVFAIGHLGTPVSGLAFDEHRGVLATCEGRVKGSDHRILPGVYATGWIRRGASGVIGTNASDAHQVAARCLEDISAGITCHEGAASGDPLSHLLERRLVDWVDRDGWNAIDQVELSRGAGLNCVRSKVTRREELLALARSGGVDPA